ncbi:protein WHAT'S THIS FACTOR 1 homolog, chloroplastic isoform X2 [Telopea speciosissima]|uniref:protein WHAT'S THIS FACTOR 1 homolog, chloroplastic isoform X1 n=1 Tax=Telopea speciosissima TaxID=54955 RepID=UPI001CC64F16|nr:protein WHAT'S THIS FACTOR 1 homolog, chloroplastic isoform X1 [Telopea speciosissima]XP_043688933.1 protein WHAT'S THIS FACTOR 1 homolog, chloroplastic isoform X2 [Telopea speciosissima]
MKSMLLLKQSRIRCLLLQNTDFLSIQIMYKSSGGRPKKKIYQRVYDLDRVMELQKKPSLILELKAIIQRQKNHSLLIRDLEKEVGFVQKWNFMSVIEKYPTIFRVGGGNRAPISVRLTEKAEKIASEEAHARELMEPILVKNLRKLLMMSMDCRIPVEKIEFIESELGLPRDFKESLIPKYPEFFSVKDINGKAYLHLESWDSSLAITSREEKLDIVAAAHYGSSDFSGFQKGVKISRDGNFSGPSAFQMNFPAGFRPNTKYLEEVQKWQKMPFPSPYLNARRFEPADPKARKRAVAVLHELLSLTMEKRMSSAQLDAFHAEYQLPCKLLLCLVKNHAIFYITNKGARSTVFLKEAYDGSNLIDKCPLLRFYDKFIALSGRKDPNLSSEISLQ